MNLQIIMENLFWEISLEIYHIQHNMHKLSDMERKIKLMFL